MIGDPLFMVGMSHRTSPVEVRERLAVETRDLPGELRRLSEAAGLSEVVLLSTCNRVEVYVGSSPRSGRTDVIEQWLTERAGQDVRPFLYEHRGEAVVRHTFRVAASLDSMVVGEPQILGQVKEAYGAARSENTLGTLLDRCFTRAFSVAKRVRSETQIAAGTVSISSIAAELARTIFGDLEGRKVLLLGAGEMGEAAAKHLRKEGASLSIVNRSRDKADRLAKTYGGRALGLEHLAAELGRVDVAIASTASPRFVLTPALMRGVVKARRHRPLFLIDIAVPRDVDPRVGEMDSVFLYDVDDLEQVAQENLRARQREAKDAERLIAEEVAAFEQWRRSGQVKPTIIALRNRVRSVLAGELARTTGRLGTLREEDRRALEKMLDAMTSKLLHSAIAELKAGADTQDGEALHRATRRLFGLDQEATSPERGGDRRGKAS